MITKETLEMINADLARDGSNDLRSARHERQSFEATTYKLDDVQKDEIKLEEELKVEEQHDISDEIDVDLDELEHWKIQNRLVENFGFWGIFFGLGVKYGFEQYRRPMYSLTTFFLIFGLSDIIYTAFDKYRNGGRLEFLQPLGFFGATFTLAVKWATAALLMNHINCLIVYTPRQYILQNKTGPTADIITNNLRRTDRVVDIYTWGVYGALSLYLIIPIKYFVFDNVYLSILPIYIPFVDVTTLNGFLISSAIQTVLGAYTGIATVMFGSGCLIAICNFVIMVDLVEHDIKTLDFMWKHPHETSIEYRHAFLENICSKLQDMRSYIKLIKRAYELHLLIYFFMAYSGQVLCIFAITKNNWVSGYATAGVIFVEMAFYCYVGTQLSIMDDKLQRIIYLQCDWNIFDLHSQKIFLLLLHASQMSNELQLGPIGTLNMATGVAIVKSIYTYYTVLSEVL